jgi:phospholipase C
MKRYAGVVVCSILAIGLCSQLSDAAQPGSSGLAKVNHVIIAMQENHSFDNYFGVLALAQNTPYHSPAPGKTCAQDTHPSTCVDGLTCAAHADGTYTCANSNPDVSGASVAAFHTNDYCPAPDLDHGWASSHKEGNFLAPNSMLKSSPNDGFARVNDVTEQPDKGVENATEDKTMGFYNETDLPFYYALAETFAIDDHYHCDVVGPTVPNRFYLLAATSFGHLTTNEIVPPLGGYKPITGTILDKLDAAGITWVDYFSDVPQAGEFRTQEATHFKPVASFFTDAATGNLPQVALVDPLLAGETNLATDEHPPHDVRAGEFFIAQIVSAVRNSPNWKDSILFVTYDEHGGAYDHQAPPPAAQKGALNPDGINPGQCADLSNPPASTKPGGGANCTTSQTVDAPALCPTFTPTGPYPSTCANFNQLGFRVPFIAVSPFAKPHYVSHTTGDHTSILKLIEMRWLQGAHLTLRDQNANPLLDMFDFVNAPLMNVNLSLLAEAPVPNLVTDGNGSCTTPSTSVP